MAAKTLVMLGTSSSAGKSLLVAALCRIYARRGVRVAPFKAQNMSNNAAVCPDGCEIGRAQAVQAAAAGLEPCVDMNPLLLKPEADNRSQVILMGRPYQAMPAQSYYARRDELWRVVTAALDRLRSRYELVVVEGAGSPVEMNLKTRDIVNMAIATYARAPVLLVGDIDRGGIFAQLLGTLWLLEPEERELVKGLIVNKFRGDLSLFEDGIRFLEQRGGVPVLGVVPFLHDMGIPEEDAMALDEPAAAAPSAEDIDIAVIHLPHIANFDDFDPLSAEPGVRLRYVSGLPELGQPQAVILPGTKSTVADLVWLRERGLASGVQALAGAGVPVVGICGGYQMLGRVIHDPDGIESSCREMAGLALLATETVFDTKKATHRCLAAITGTDGWLAALVGQTVSGYEIHMGRTSGNTPWLAIKRGDTGETVPADGATSENGKVWGCYLHGLFANENLRRAWLASLGWREAEIHGYVTAAEDAAFDRLAGAVEAAIDMDELDRIVGLNENTTRRPDA